MMNNFEERLASVRQGIMKRAAAMKEKAKKQGFEFKPFSRKQKQVLTWWCPSSPVKDKDGIIADGAIRSGKTLCMSLSYVLWAMESFNQQNFGMAGKTIGSFRRNVLFWLKLMLKSRGYQVVDHRSDNLIVVSKGDTQNFFYIFGGKDERSQDLIQGITLAGMFFDEVALMPESFVNQATGRCSVTGSKFWFNCNPNSPRHWFKVNWIDKRDEKRIIYLHFTMDDNLSLSEQIKERYRSMYVGVFFKRYILGLWCVAEGLVYSMFDEEKHVTDEHMSGALEYIVSIDYGTVNPFSAGLWAFDGKNSQREAELYYNSREAGKRVDDEAYYKMLKELIGDRKVSYIIIDPSAASFIEVIKKYGEYTVKKADNDVLDGIRVVTTMLNKGLLKIYKDCTSCINEFGLYCWDEEKNNDTVIKENDHAMDDTRYYVYTFLRRRLRWKY
jgi:PBSX family phage terminase large subunit